MSTIKNYRGLTDDELKSTFIERISEKMSKADWYSDYSDDYTVRQRGADEFSKILEDLRLLIRVEDGLNNARKLWNEHAPKDCIEPLFLREPLREDGVLGGKIMKHDLFAVQQILQDFQKEGSRFVAIDSDPFNLPERRFKGFESAIPAKNFAYENKTLEKKFEVHSIASLQHEIQRVLDPRLILKDIAEKLQEYDRGNNRFNSHELSK